MSFWMNLLRLALAGMVLVLPVLTGCAKWERTDNGRVPVAIHGVNHTADEFTFVVADPLDKKTSRVEKRSLLMAQAARCAASTYRSNGVLA